MNRFTRPASVPLARAHWRDNTPIPTPLLLPLESCAGNQAGESKKARTPRQNRLYNTTRAFTRGVATSSSRTASRQTRFFRIIFWGCVCATPDEVHARAFPSFHLRTFPDLICVQLPSSSVPLRSSRARSVGIRQTYQDAIRMNQNFFEFQFSSLIYGCAL